MAFTLFPSCNKDNGDVIPGVSTGKAAPVGSVTGTKVEKEMGASGGQITSDDGKMTIIVPAGALSSSTQFSVQRISNTNPGSVEEAYRLLPHGENFQKPL
ncbi:MAG TPA: hypothetical protein PKE30_10380 [Niabella sp.]|nr:hypothetical protein [Niabella sp.]